MLTAADCDSVSLLLTLKGPTLIVFDETLPIEVDGLGSPSEDGDMLPSAKHSLNGCTSGTD